MQDYIPRPIDVNAEISSFSVKQYDNNSRKVYLDLRDTDNPNEVVVNLENHTVRTYFKLPDDSVEFVDGEVIDPDEGRIAVTIPNSVTQLVGEVKCEVGISGTDDGTFISLRVFSFKVIESIRDDSAIEATEKYSALDTALQTMESFDTRITALEQSGGGTGSTAIDSVLSTESVNPVQNRVIALTLREIQQQIDTSATLLNEIVNGGE